MRVNDLRTLHALVNECRDLGADPIIWREHLFRGLARMVGAELVMGGELAGLQTGMPRDLGTVDVGWDGGFNRAGWMSSLELLQNDPAGLIIIAAYAKRATEDGSCFARSDMLPDREWYGSTYYAATYQVMGGDHSLTCVRNVASLSGVHNGVVLIRAAGDPDFNARQKAIVQESQMLVAALIGGSLAQFGEPSPLALPPRVREVLRCLLEGDSDKQIAARLGISKYTVNQYVKVIFAHFVVMTRSELLARWIRRSWGLGSWDSDRK